MIDTILGWLVLTLIVFSFIFLKSWKNTILGWLVIFGVICLITPLGGWLIAFEFIKTIIYSIGVVVTVSVFFLAIIKMIQEG